MMFNSSRLDSRKLVPTRKTTQNLEFKFGMQGLSHFGPLSVKSMLQPVLWIDSRYSWTFCCWRNSKIVYEDIRRPHPHPSKNLGCFISERLNFSSYKQASFLKLLKNTLNDIPCSFQALSVSCSLHLVIQAKWKCKHLKPIMK
jgi:hypothetical protein